MSGSKGIPKKVIVENRLSIKEITEKKNIDCFLLLTPPTENIIFTYEVEGSNDGGNVQTANTNDFSPNSSSVTMPSGACR